MKRSTLAAALLALMAAAVWPASPAPAEDEPTTESGFTFCHRTAEGFDLISVPPGVEVAQTRIDERRAQGDLLPGEHVPMSGGPGKYLDEDCEPVSWLHGVTLGGCVSVAGSATPCDPASVGSAAGSGGLFASGSAVVQDLGVEFISADGAVQADFDGDHLAVTVSPGQPALRFIFDFGAWQLWDDQQVGLSTLPVVATEGASRQFSLTTASTEGAAGPQTVMYRLKLEHSAGVSPFRNTTIAIEPASIPADGVSTATVTVQLLDVLGRPPAEERAVELFMNQQFGAIGPVTYVADGLYTATLTAGLAPGVATVVAMVDFLDLDLTEGKVTLTPLSPPP